jgi:hypothetical protein
MSGMIVAIEEYKMQNAKCIEKCFRAENGCNNHKAKRCYCRMRAQKGENAIFTRSLQNRRNDEYGNERNARRHFHCILNERCVACLGRFDSLMARCLLDCKSEMMRAF